MIPHYPYTQLFGELIPHVWHHCKEGIKRWDENLHHWWADGPFQVVLWKEEKIRYMICNKNWKQQLSSCLLPAQKVRFLNPNKWSNSSSTKMPGSKYAGLQSTLKASNTPLSQHYELCCYLCKTWHQTTNFFLIPAGNQLGPNAQQPTLLPT